ncbi:ABC transporter ATP-binding protein [Shimia sagamensis]|uniref:NitT/TauT family transport system ATP-binding protein n=1 Tax=Shimia sagamensis TaxID=1566352 RepID=A0ABY1PFM6_9RHOB|nr:ATP-binding cassette domain-containing protein [Shimia sagamensis]SMP31063.1 NitT/TauT family transport system ATP-binding protein [Shimia sagamensis]
MTLKPVLQLSNLGHAYLGRKVLADINVTVESGEVLALVGPSGCGKSTLAHISSGILQVHEGAIERRYKRHAMIFQDTRLMPWATAAENIAYPLRLARIPRRQRRAHVLEAAQKVHLLPDDLIKFPVELSGGMQQRTAIARALVAHPDFVYYDEPFTALDVALKRRMQDLVISNAIATKTAGLFITHDLNEAARVAHRIVVLQANGHGILGTRQVPGSPGSRSDETLAEWVRDALRNDPLFAQIFDVDERAIT